MPASIITTKLIFFILIFLAVFLEAIADVLLKKWSLDNNGVLLVLGMIVYMVGTVFWVFSLRMDYLSRAISIFTVLNLIVIVLVGVLIFKENLSPVNKLGIILGIVSVILVEL